MNFDSSYKEIPSIDFIRVSKMPNLHNGKVDLFKNPIKPGQLIFSQNSDQ